MGNCLLKKGGKDFPRIVIEVGKKSLCDPCLSLWGNIGGSLNKIVWGQNMIDNLLGLSINLRVLEIGDILLKLDYAMRKLKNFVGKSQE